MVVLSVLIGVVACINPREGYAPEQPIKFSHNIHSSQQEIPCTYCHVTVAEGPSASVPGLNTCMNCHSAVKNIKNPESIGQQKAEMLNGEIKKLRKKWREGDPVRWTKVHDMPDHVQFSHQPHMLEGISCQKCHGQIPKSSIDKGPGQVDRVEVSNRFNMGWCVNCHRKDKNNAPVDCATCHY